MKNLKKKLKINHLNGGIACGHGELAIMKIPLWLLRCVTGI